MLKFPVKAYSFHNTGKHFEYSCSKYFNEIWNFNNNNNNNNNSKIIIPVIFIKYLIFFLMFALDCIDC